LNGIEIVYLQVNVNGTFSKQYMYVVCLYFIHLYFILVKCKHTEKVKKEATQQQQKIVNSGKITLKKPRIDI